MVDPYLRVERCPLCGTLAFSYAALAVRGLKQPLSIWAVELARELDKSHTDGRTEDWDRWVTRTEAANCAEVHEYEFVPDE
jgi:hypothetical protein